MLWGVGLPISLNAASHETSDYLCRYALMLFCMGVGALFANGASGPLPISLNAASPDTSDCMCRYALMLFCMGVGALFANGASGPLAALLTLLLPPEIKSFALSVHEFVVFLLGPIYGVIMGVSLQVGASDLHSVIFPKSESFGIDLTPRFNRIPHTV